MIKHQIVGYSNSGKTTVAAKLIRMLTKTGYSCATIKHHGDRTPLSKEPAGKDTAKHRQAGACGTLAASDSEMVLTLQHNRAFSLNDFINFYNVLSLDVLLIEGYKKEKYPKTILLRTENDLPLLKKAVNIKCVLCRDQSLVDLVSDNFTFPVFYMEDMEDYLKWFLKRVEKGDYDE